MIKGVFRRLAPWALLAAAVALVVATPAPVSAQVSTAEIEVSVVDEDGLALPGVTVRAVNQDTGRERLVVSGSNGLALMSALPPGVYSVSGELDSFATVTAEGVEIRVGQTARVTFTMRPQLSETITVTAEAPLVDLLRNDASTNIVPEQIEELPVANRDFEKLAFIAPNVQRERGGFRFIQGAPVVGGGGNASQTSILVDGLEYTDQALGLARTRFSQDAIQEFRVISSRFDTEIGGSQGGALSVVTKSGTNTTRGSVFGFWRDDSLRTEGELETGEQDFSRTQVGFTLGGPIVQDQTHYFFSFEYIDQDDIAPFRPLGAFADQATDYENPIEQTLALGSLDHQFSMSSSLQVKAVFERYREKNFRVGGVADISNGQSLNRDNWNVNLGHTWVLGDGDRLNELRGQIGQRDYDEPTNSQEVEEWFSGGNTLRIGNNVVGDLIGEGSYWEIRDTYHYSVDTKSWGTHDWKLGASLFHVEERSVIDTFQEGLFIYADDTRAFPTVYIYGDGSSDITVETDIWSFFIQDDWKPRPNFTFNYGLRYDLDTDGNNPDFTHPLVGPRDKDEDNFQPRIGFTWDPGNDGVNVIRGGAGLFTGRYLLVPSFTELQQNGVTGRVTRQNLNGLVLCLSLGIPLDQCPFPPINPADPENSGVPLGVDISLLQDNLQAPEAVQATLGYTRRLGDTGLYASLEGIYVEGDEEIVIRDVNFGGNDNPVRLNPDYNQINMYRNDGHSEYKSVVLSVNGTLSGGHLITASATWADKKNIADDFSPVFPTGYPSDPADIEAEYGRSRADEEWRVVVSGVFRLPWQLTVAPIYEYGSGQPWNRILGYDFNGDGKNSDRAAGVPRNSEDGPDFSSFSLRLTKTFTIGDAGDLDLVLEGFNLFDSTNYDVTSVVQGEYLSGPTLANPDAPLVENPAFGEYLATLDPRTLQVGLRFSF